MVENPTFQGQRVVWLREYLPTIVLGLTLASSLAGNVLLAWRAQTTSRELVRVTALLPKGGVKTGTAMPTLPVKTTQGIPQDIHFDEGTTILYVVSQTCSWCRANEANMRTVAAANSKRFRFVGVVLEPKNLSAYAERTRMPFDLMGLNADEAFRDQVGFTGTPQTVVVRPGGVIEKVWVGAWNGQRATEVSTFFQTKLPGLESSKESAKGDK